MQMTPESLWMFCALKCVQDETYLAVSEVMIELHPTNKSGVTSEDFEKQDLLLYFQLSPDEHEFQEALASLDADALLDFLEKASHDPNDESVSELFIQGIFKFLSTAQRRIIERDVQACLKERATHWEFALDLVPILLRYPTHEGRDLRLKKWEKALVSITGTPSIFLEYWTARLRHHANKKDWVHLWDDLHRALTWAQAERTDYMEDFIAIAFHAMAEAGILDRASIDFSPADPFYATRLSESHRQRLRIVRTACHASKLMKKKGKARSRQSR